MKYLSVLFFTLFTTSAFASDLASTVRDIEIEKNAKCSQTSTSFGLCFGSANGISGTCFYSVKFSCTSNTGEFGLKIKMKNIMGKSSVRKVVYLN